MTSGRGGFLPPPNRTTCPPRNPAVRHRSRQLRGLGHTVRLMPPSYVKAYLKRRKNDANDAAATCEAVTPPAPG